MSVGGEIFGGTKRGDLWTKWTEWTLWTGWTRPKKRRKEAAATGGNPAVQKKRHGKAQAFCNAPPPPLSWRRP